MLRFFILSVFFSVFQIQAQGDPDKGHPEHFVAGMVIGGTTSYFVFKKTDNKFKAWCWGTGASVEAGLAKELLDNAIGRKSSGQDFGYTALGGTIGTSIVIPLNKRRQKEITYLY